MYSAQGGPASIILWSSDLFNFLLSALLRVRVPYERAAVGGGSPWKSCPRAEVLGGRGRETKDRAAKESGATRTKSATRPRGHLAFSVPVPYITSQVLAPPEKDVALWVRDTGSGIFHTALHFRVGHASVCLRPRTGGSFLSCGIFLWGGLWCLRRALRMSKRCCEKQPGSRSDHQF